MNALDTNVWVYSHDTRDPIRRQIALDLVNAVKDDVALPWQVGCEFIAASRKLLTIGFTAQDAWDALRRMRGMARSIILPIPDSWDRAEALMPRFGLSFWDALLAAACIGGGVTTLYSEDFGTLTAIDSLSIVHPFPPAP